MIQGWDRIIPVGIMWGNDPELTPTKAEAGQKPKESWINPQADAIRTSLGGTRPSWGWHGRLNGPGPLSSRFTFRPLLTSNSGQLYICLRIMSLRIGKDQNTR